ncbi:hypothetical protein QMO39_32065, partial [Pseudomonas aeruginosa]|nr:hypothetical protein [Pseudomonas aeruginosa]
TPPPLPARPDLQQLHPPGHSLRPAVALNRARLAPQRLLSPPLIGSAGLGDATNGAHPRRLADAANPHALNPPLAPSAPAPPL